MQYRMLHWLMIVVLLIAGAGATHVEAGEHNNAPVTTPSTLDWLEPLSLNIVDLVGQAPESVLSGTIISFTPGYGIVRYQAGLRQGNTVVLTAKIYPRFVIDGAWNGSLFGCLGQPAKNDQLGSVAPPATVRIFNGAQDVTRQATLYHYVPAGKNKPIRNPVQSEQQNLYRYYESPMLNSSFTADGQLILPGNMGCEIILSYHDYRELTAVFTVQAPPVIKVSVVGSQDFVFHSYLGAGYAGHLQALVDQLYRAGYPERHEKLPMNIPPDADYFLLNLPPTSADANTAFPGNPLGNVDRLSGGTYRFVIGYGLTVDHVNGIGFPLYGNWQDADQSSGQFLKYVKLPTLLAGPEYFLPPGVPYHSCMTNGGCSPALLDQVYNTANTLHAYYLRVERTSADLQRYAVQMVGPAWSPVAAAGASATSSRFAWPVPAATPTRTPFDHYSHLPIIIVSRSSLPPDDPTGCSLLGGCGWFTQDGRMVDYIPMP